MLKKYLTPSEAAEYIGVSIQLLQKWRSQGIGIPYIKLGDSTSSPIRYSIEELEAFILSKTMKTM